MEKGYKNLSELKDFIELHDLSDMYSIIHFAAAVSIETAQNKIQNEIMEVRITFDDYDSYGKVFLVSNDLDPYLYPTVFEAKWQEMEHINNVYLQISDTHRRNSIIGKYRVLIVPQRKFRD